jgi:hypothetical protein
MFSYAYLNWMLRRIFGYKEKGINNRRMAKAA